MALNSVKLFVCSGTSVSFVDQKSPAISMPPSKNSPLVCLEILPTCFSYLNSDLNYYLRQWYNDHMTTSENNTAVN